MVLYQPVRLVVLHDSRVSAHLRQPSLVLTASRLLKKWWLLSDSTKVWKLCRGTWPLSSIKAAANWAGDCAATPSAARLDTAADTPPDASDSAGAGVSVAVALAELGCPPDIAVSMLGVVC